MATAPKLTAVSCHSARDPSPNDVIAPLDPVAAATVACKGNACDPSVKSTKAIIKHVAKKKAGSGAKPTKSSFKSTKATAKQKSTV